MFTPGCCINDVCVCTFDPCPEPGAGGAGGVGGAGMGGAGGAGMGGAGGN
ncbi:MAG: hypothetical protein HUU21_40165 [Polyangiaceae bacterium]|nr:hypothetical protein [Polyangiaceae bacterium]